MGSEEYEVRHFLFGTKTLIFILVASFSLFLILGNYEAIVNHKVFGSDNSRYEIPDWVKDNAYWYSQDLITPEEFSMSIEYLIDEGIITLNDEVE